MQLMGTPRSISSGNKTEKQHVENTFAFENRFENKPRGVCLTSFFSTVSEMCFSSTPLDSTTHPVEQSTGAFQLYGYEQTCL